VRSTVGDDVVVLVTADHGQVDTTDEARPIHDDVIRLVRAISGEDRFVWLHTDHVDEAVQAARRHHGDEVVVVTREEVLDRTVFGRRCSPEALDRMGDVALLSRGCSALIDPAKPPPSLRGRHGSLTPAEMLVPLLSVPRSCASAP